MLVVDLFRYDESRESDEERMRLCGARFVGVTMALVSTGAVACIPAISSEDAKSPPYSSPDATTTREHRMQPIAVAKVSDPDTIAVTVFTQRECRDGTPMVRDVGTRHHLQGGAASYVVNALGSAILAGVGIGLLATSCDASNGCTPQQGQTVQLTGGVVLASAAIPIALIIWNAIRSSDNVSTVPAENDRPWEACGKRTPLSSTTVALKLSDGQTIGAQTDSDGDATIDLSDASISDSALSTGKASVIVNGKLATGGVTFAGLSKYEAWKAAAAQARESAARAESARVSALPVCQTLRECVMGCLSYKETCIASTPPMTPERLACLDDSCSQSCVIAARNPPPCRMNMGGSAITPTLPCAGCPPNCSATCLQIGNCQQCVQREIQCRNQGCNY